MGYDGEFHGGYMELIIHFNRNFHSKPTNHFWVPPFLRNPFMYIYIYMLYIHICKYQPFDHLSAQDIKLQHQQTRLAPGSPGYRNPPQRLPIHWLFAPGFTPRKPNEAMNAMSLEGLVVSRDWWFQPTIGW